MIKKTTEMFKKEVKEKYGDEYTVLGKYTRNCDKILMKHNKCGHEYLVTPMNFLKGRRCPKCFKTPKKTTDIFKKEIYDKYGDEFEILGEYINNATKITVRHNKCGNVYDIRPTHLLHKARCRYCSNVFKKDKDWINNRLKEINSDIVVIGEVINMNRKVKCRCSKGHEFISIPSNLLKGHGCSVCSGNAKHTVASLEKLLQEKQVDDSYKILSIIDHKVKVYHSKCGHTYTTSKQSIFAGSGCVKCCSSKGENEVRRVLLEMNKEFIEQYKFKECKYKRELPFDFFLPKENTCIEFDGEQHFTPYRYKKKGIESSKEKFISTKRNDKIKDNFCKDNSIKLIRIPYYDFKNVETILKTALK